MFNWVPQDGGFRCEMPGNVTLVVTPDRIAKGIAMKPARGTKWHAQCTHWDERTSTASRYGRDEYLNLQGTSRAAMRLAEDIYMERQGNAR
ncbi:hypothetical protein EVC03_026 [Rhizobium phage RHph_Y5A]|nr:hypothetical protein EVC03_026 [Rhizobium phage RHph_Y5A]QIG75468.1 hypothetical protein EVC18_026 [Rhizobium phage RHph_Y2_4]